MRHRPHVVVCGAGLAGLTAAVTALEHGAAVTLVEKGAAVGGSSAISGGFIWTFAEAKAMYQTIPDGNPALQELVHSSLGAERKWLQASGAKLGEEQHFAFRGHTGQFMDPPQAIGSLVDTFLKLGGDLLVETALEQVRTARGRTIGATLVDSHGGVRDVDAGAVVLATGGFSGNPELIRRYVAPSADNLYLRGNGWNTGDGLMAAAEVGAGLTRGLETFYGHAMIAPPGRFNYMQFREVSQYYGARSVAINLDGRRFADESAGTGEEVLNQELARQREGRGFYLLDQQVLGVEAVDGRVAASRVVERAKSLGAPFAEADTLDELYERLGDFGIPPATVRDTVETYNQACASGSTHFLFPSRAKYTAGLQHGPFVAVGVKASITFTMGGIAVDDNMRVLRRALTTSPMAQSISEESQLREAPIAGLFAAGCDVGNISHRNYMGGLGPALVTGRVAGRHAAGAAMVTE